MSVFHSGWEKELEHQMFQIKTTAYICSPLSASTDEGIIENMYAARAYMYYAWKVLHYNSRAPHAYLPIILCDRKSSERTLAMKFGTKLMRCSDVVLVCGEKLSEGMKLEIIYASKHQLDVFTFSEGMFNNVSRLIENSDGDATRVRIFPGHSLMATQNPIAFLEGGDQHD